SRSRRRGSLGRWVGGARRPCAAPCRDAPALTHERRAEGEPLARGTPRCIAEHRRECRVGRSTRAQNRIAVAGGGPGSEPCAPPAGAPTPAGVGVGGRSVSINATAPRAPRKRNARRDAGKF